MISVLSLVPDKTEMPEANKVKWHDKEMMITLTTILEHITFLVPEPVVCLDLNSRSNGKLITTVHRISDI